MKTLDAIGRRRYRLSFALLFGSSHRHQSIPTGIVNNSNIHRPHPDQIVIEVQSSPTPVDEYERDGDVIRRTANVLVAAASPDCRRFVLIVLADGVSLFKMTVVASIS